MTLAGRTCLVTGGCGFIGSHLSERLVEEGARVRVLVHYNSEGRRGWLETSDAADRIEFVPGDVRDRDSLRPAVEGADVVFHLAALIAIPYSFRAPASFVDTNVTGTLNVMRLAAEAGVDRVVHTSTSEVYGTALEVPISEDHPLQGQSPYAASKIGGDKMAEALHRQRGVPLVTVRPFNTYGPRQSERAVIPTIIGQCLSGEGEVRLGNLSPTRDFNYVADTVDGFVRAAVADGAVGRTLNVGSGREVSIGELVDVIADVVGTDVTVVQEEERVRPDDAEVDRLLCDATRAREVLGWEPRHTLEEGLEETVDWFRDHAGRYRGGEYAL